MKKILILAISITYFPLTQLNAQTTKKAAPFSKENAYTWLNAKLDLDPDDAGFDSNHEVEARKSQFYAGTYSSKIRRVKILWPSPNKELYSNTFTAPLKDLNPGSLTIKSVKDEHNDKFYIVVQTTNSCKCVRRDIFGAEGNLEESRMETDLWIGPFPNQMEDEEKMKIKSVIKRLIVACGGKEDLF
jgi:hypothetical protein